MKRMEINYHQGDLADVIGATGTNNNAATPDWQLGGSNNPMGYYSVVPSSSEDFGDPFINILRDPDLLHHTIDTPPMEGSGFFPRSHSMTSETSANRGWFGTAGDSNGSINPSEDLPHHHQEIKKRPPSNIFSRISPKCDPPTSMPAAATGLKIIAPMLIIPNDHHGTANLISSKSCLLGGESPGRLQISSTPPSAAIKRRKSETKKVVCILAPAAANSRASGEVVPSDLWAWRKYGQKPIKGSPYPRGYYRCSSSKGCSARKQVERSRTDPNMLVITYTWEHNHPWPTQRNALAGSSRSSSLQPTRTTSNNVSPNSQKYRKQDEHPQERGGDGSQAIYNVKDEELMDQFDHFENMDSTADQFDEGYRDSSHSEDSFFAELGEIEADPLHLHYSQLGFSGENKSLDAFNYL